MKPKIYRTMQRAAPAFLKLLLSADHAAADPDPLFEDSTERTVKN